MSMIDIAYFDMQCQRKSAAFWKNFLRRRIVCDMHQIERKDVFLKHLHE
jgi:hypothetical protein